jgi:hypothetical protein
VGRGSYGKGFHFAALGRDLDGGRPSPDKVCVSLNEYFFSTTSSANVFGLLVCKVDFLE